MRLQSRSLLLISAAALLLIIPPTYLLMAERSTPSADPVQTLNNYLRAAYARDYEEAYRLISSEDRRLKDEKSYVRERGSFTGFTLDVANKLAEFIESAPTKKTMSGNRAHITLKLRLPDANKLSTQLLDWDEERLNALSREKQRALIRSLDQWSAKGQLPMIEGEQSFELVKEKRDWKLFLNWAAGTQVLFQARVDPSLPLDVRWDQREFVIRPGELFNVHFRIKNQSQRQIFTKIPHRVEPKELSEYLELVECGLFSPMRLLPREEREYSSTYLVRGDLPDGTRQLAVTYEFVNVR